MNSDEILKVKLNLKLDKLGIKDKIQREQAIKELDCLSNLIIDAYLQQKNVQRKTNRSE